MEWSRTQRFDDNASSAWAQRANAPVCIFPYHAFQICRDAHKHAARGRLKGGLGQLLISMTYPSRPCPFVRITVKALAFWFGARYVPTQNDNLVP
jgi:hypothetical protein